MSRGERRLSLSVLLALLLALALLLLQIGAGANAPKVYRVSVLLDGTDAEYWKNFLNGVNQAAREQNVDVRIVSRYEGEVGEAQAEALRRAWEGDTDGIVLIPASDSIAAALDDAPAGLAVSVASPALSTGHRVGYTAADGFEMGRRLADAIAGDEHRFCTIYRPGGTSPAAALLYDGLTARLNELGIGYSTVQSVPESIPIPLGGALAAVDPATAEALCRLETSAGRVYGAGTSSRLLYYLEDKSAAALVTQSDYDAGYLALTGVVSALEGERPQSTTLDSYTVTGESMFVSPQVDFLFSTP